MRKKNVVLWILIIISLCINCISIFITRNAYGVKADAETPPAIQTANMIIISKSLNQLRVFADKKLIATYSVATGRHGCTPEGRFVVVNKAVSPGKAALGSRWMGLNKVGRSGRRYGIHGTNQPDSIGKWRSAGCVRLHNDNAVKLFDITPVGTTVVIINDKFPDNPQDDTTAKVD